MLAKKFINQSCNIYTTKKGGFLGRKDTNTGRRGTGKKRNGIRGVHERQKNDPKIDPGAIASAIVKMPILICPKVLLIHPLHRAVHPIQ